MLSSLPSYVSYILAIMVSAIISLYTVKKIIFIARKRKIYDIPDNIRKIHGEEIPSLGGIGIFTGYIATIPFFISMARPGWDVIITSTLILFFTGVYDDLVNMSPTKKLLAQLIAAIITVKFTDLHIPAMYGALWMDDPSPLVSMATTAFCCTFFINVFNFIDGIDGLASMLSILYCGVLGGIFAMSGHVAEACISFSLLGATAGLLYYNYSPAKIYMGDTGSMMNGFSIFILCVFLLRFISGELPEHLPFFIPNGHVALKIVVAILFYPVFDALRVFVLRMAKGISPLKADRRHLHYYLLDSGMSHAATAWLITGVNALTILIAIVLQRLPFVLLIVLIALPSVVTSFVAHRRLKSKVN